MAGDDDDLRALWRAQPTKEVPTMSMEELRSRSEELAHKVKARKWRETIAGVASGVALLAFAVRGPRAPLVQIACVMLVIGEALVLARIWQYGAPARPPEDGSTSGYLSHYRGALVKERELLSTVLRWYLGPVLPGLLFLPVAVCLEAGVSAVAVGAMAALSTALVCAIIVAVNRRAARRLTREIEALDAG